MTVVQTEQFGFQLMCCVVSHYEILYHYNAIFYYIMLYCVNAMFCIVFYCTALYCVVSCCVTYCNGILYCYVILRCNEI